MATRTTNIGLFANGDVLTEAHLDSLPAGWLGYVERTADQTGITSEVTIGGLSVAVPVNASRRIKVSAHVVAGGSVVGERYAVYLKEGSTQLIGDPQTVPIADNTISTMKFSPAVILTPSAGTHTYSVTIARITGTTGNASVQAASTQPAWLLVEDIGPAS